MNLLYKIKVLSKELPGKDKELAENFINNRNFESLLEIVNSDIYLVNKNSVSETPKEKYLGVDVEKLLELKCVLEEYLSYLGISDDTKNFDYND